MTEVEKRIDDAIAKLKAECPEPVYWYGPVQEAALTKLEELLGVGLPPSFATFLRKCGGGGEEGAMLSGVSQSDPLRDGGSTVWGDTRRCREELALPQHLVVVFRSHDEVCWCIDTSRKGQRGEPPVVSYDVFKKKVDRQIATDFLDLLEQYVAAHTSEDDE